MAREKKISVRPYLNKKAKSNAIQMDQGELYPLYFQAIYDQKTTRFKIGNHLYPLALEDDLATNESIIEICNTIKKIIHRESSRKASFEIKGVGDKVRSYMSPIGDAVLLATLNKVDEVMAATLSNVGTYEEYRLYPPRDRLGMFVEYTTGVEPPERIKDLFVCLGALKSVLEDNVTIYEWVLGENKRVLKNNVAKILKGSERLTFEMYGVEYKYNITQPTELIMLKIEELANFLIDEGIYVHSSNNSLEDFKQDNQFVIEFKNRQ